MAVAKEIIDNVRDTKIVDFLRKENVEKIQMNLEWIFIYGWVK